MKWLVIADSSCDIREGADESADIGYATVPFVMRIGHQDFRDDETLKTAEMVDAMEKCGSASQTACPSPHDWLNAFAQDEPCFAVTISGELSGSFDSACVARGMTLEKQPGRSIAVIDSRSAGAGLVLIVRRLRQWIEQGLDFSTIESNARALAASTHTVFALCSFNNLVKNGRMSRLAGLLAGKLGIWGIGVSDNGKIRVKEKTRGIGRVLNALIADMESHGYSGSLVAVSHCLNLDLAERFRELVRTKWRDAEVILLPARGLCSYYAERGGLIVAY